MTLAAGMDPEEWGELMERFFAIVREGVNRFDGRIDKFTGDGVMALFGAPIAYEDHARRASACSSKSERPAEPPRSLPSWGSVSSERSGLICQRREAAR